MEDKLYRVMWQDHCSVAEWLSLPEAMSMKPVLAETVGWLVVDTEEYIVIAGERGQMDVSVSNITVIIKSCVVGINEL